MAYKTPEPANSSIGSLMNNIMADVEKLLRQEIALLRAELRNEWRKLKHVAAYMVAAAVAALVGVTLLGQALAYLISELTSAPLSVGYFLVTLLFFATSVTLVMLNRKRVKELEFVPKETLQSISTLFPSEISRTVQRARNRRDDIFLAHSENESSKNESETFIEEKL